MATANSGMFAPVEDAKVFESKPGNRGYAGTLVDAFMDSGLDSARVQTLPVVGEETVEAKRAATTINRHAATNKINVQAVAREGSLYLRKISARNGRGTRAQAAAAAAAPAAAS